MRSILSIVYRARRGAPLALLACLSSVLGMGSTVPASATQGPSADYTSAASLAVIYVPLVGNARPASPLAYASSYGAIFVINPDGSAKTNLTQTLAISESGPQWSPEANKIAYMSTPLASSTYAVYLMNADGSGKTKLCDACADPAWSPDGARLAVVQWGTGAKALPDIFVMHADGSTTTKLCTACENPAWLPDANRLAFEGDCVSPIKGPHFCGRIYTINADGSAATGLCTNCSSPAVAPDGVRIAFVQGGDVFVMNVDGSGKTNLSNTPAVPEYGPQWSPDGYYLAFLGHYSDVTGWYEIYVANADGSAKTNVTNTPDLDESEPQWSPDGYHLAYQQSDFAPGRKHNADIFVMNANGSGKTNLTNTPDESERSAVWLSGVPRIAGTQP